MKTNQRTTLARQIRNADDTNAAIEIAIHGKPRSELEKAVDQYYFWTKDIVHHEKGSDTWKEVNTCREDSASHLLGLMLDAIDKRDGGWFRGLADLVENRKHHSPLADNARSSILTFKSILERDRRRMSLPRLAELMHWSGELSHLRRLARQLKFPLTRGRPGRPKNGDK